MFQHIHVRIQDGALE
uniref:Uncharacterized protein n=1 Tax=Lepeophtheirus salmonis TaxID=72036 RepID=A0A0K2SVM6_LEPSM